MKRLLGISCLLILLVGASFRDSRGDATAPTVTSQEVSETDGVPVLLKHLPDWETVSHQAIFANNAQMLKQAMGEHPIVDLIDLTGGTEAVTAQYPAGRLLIIEYMSPQASIEADSRFTQYLSDSGSTDITYRRIGNYNAFVFGAVDAAAANALLDQVKYEKNIQWLGEDPFLFQRLERAFVTSTSDLFISTVEIIVLGFGLSIVGGLIVGIIYFRVRDRQRLSMNAFSDAGGMVRLNLDGLSADTFSDRLLND
jgi:hypothetical protein